ncbi:hypothetical protein NC797_06640 [Aquibacillus sp. 3ASR75-11]|uniref:Uncharacterized protein n=1 Tax=Terrihalobacillus insolitus TaxID=2950438 RepID=A0A9X3WVI0_9BACI|nr:hypothetical protein [Terrihalobacillus insolitus]MDC3414703.1 hypothetical protein [Terrihalobacillus insolitus]MDC3424184.1 hypothetical protein [Terrihalobacillus insolitus]
MSNLAEYKKYRRTGVKLNSNILKSAEKDRLLTAANLLGMVGKDKKTTIFDGEQENDYHFDFMFNEVLDNERSVVATYKDQNPPNNNIEEEFIDAMMSAFTSLFTVVSVSEKASTIELVDLSKPTKSG